MDFVHLHVHTEYSLLDGLPKIKKLVGKVKELGMNSLAITDHGAMYGAIEFYKEATKEGIKPIIGMEAYTTLSDHKYRPQKGEPKPKTNHLLLLAKNEEGYKNLMKITSIAHLEGYYYRPRITRDLLAKYSKGLICTSACPQGEIAQALAAQDYKQAKDIAKWFSDCFGDDYYLEVQRHEYEKHKHGVNDKELAEELSTMVSYEKIINEGVFKLSTELGIPVVATNDSHYVSKDDAEAQDILVCVATGKMVSDTKRLRFIDTPTFYLRSPEEMSILFADHPEVLQNTAQVAKKVDIQLSTLGKWFFPKFPVPDNLSENDYLKKLTYDRVEERVGKVTNEVKSRLEYELDIIIKKGYAPYFLIVMDMVNWASERGIITNTRGSAAGSLVSYVLGITTVNPLDYYLPFERFLNPYRPSPPDIDFDISDNRREEVISYIIEKYGRAHVAQICTFGRMLARAAVRDVARVLGYEYGVGDRISKMIPPPKQGFPIDVLRALEKNPELAHAYNTESDSKKILDLAHHVEGSARHISVHAAGVVVSPSDLTEFTPLQLEPSGDKVITQYEFHTCEDVGLIKFDILGIRNLSILGSAIDIVKKNLGIDIDLHKIPLDDTKTFKMLGSGDTMGVFQMGGSGMTKYLKELKPTRIEDLMAMVALYRPGPMQVIPEYIARKHNPKLIKYLDPRMKKFLDMSYGLIVYQDDLLFCALELAGYSWEEADKFRKAVGKKIPEEMAAQKEKFMGGIVANGQTKGFAEDLWKLFEPFQSYGFNKAHAASYGMVAYYTAYMKANYPVEYMCALMTAESGDTDKITEAIAECRRVKIKILPPDINESDVGFKIVKNDESLSAKAIRFGLGAIKNVGVAAIEAILAERNINPFRSFGDFISRVDNRKVNKKVLESLIKVGAMSAFGSRSSLLSSIEEVRSQVSRNKADKGQQELFGSEVQTKDIKSEALGSIEKFTDDEIQNLERQLLGFSLSAKPISELLGTFSFAATHKIKEIVDENLVNVPLKIAAIVTEVRTVVTKKTGQEMAFVKVDDGTGTIDLVVFPKIFQATRNFWVDFKPLLVSGRADMRDDSYSLIVESIETSDAQAASLVHIKIPKGTTPESLMRLKALLESNPGNQPVSLVFEGTGKKLNLNIKIAWSETLARQISELLVLEVS